MSILYDPTLALAFYGALACLAVWSTWSRLAPWRGRDDLWTIGAVLMLGFAASNILKATIPIMDQAGPFSFIEVIIAVTAFYVWSLQRSRLLIALVGLNLASIGANIAFALNFPPTGQQIFLWEVTTNVCFAGECLLASWLGIAHGYRTGRFVRRVRLGGRAAQPDAAREGQP
jgi:hypothetical protein